MTRLLPVGVALAVMLYAATALGGEKQCVPDHPDQCVQPLAEGEAAPFPGQLYTPELALDHSEKVHSFDERLTLEIKRLRAEFDIKLQLANKIHDVDTVAAAAREKALREALEEAIPPFYERPWFVAMLTSVVVTSLVMGAIALSAELGQVVWAQ